MGQRHSGTPILGTDATSLFHGSRSSELLPYLLIKFTVQVRVGQLGTYSMNHPWLTTIDWPVSAFDLKEARNHAVSATSSIVANS
jgi:hypothetical protein